MASTMRGVALAALSDVPYPSCPCPLPPQEYTAPPSASATVCLLAVAMAATRTRSADTLYHRGHRPVPPFVAIEAKEVNTRCKVTKCKVKLHRYR